MTPAAVTELNGRPLVDSRQQSTLVHGDKLKLGALEFEFRTTGVSYDGWLDAKKKILLDEDETGLFLMREITSPNDIYIQTTYMIPVFSTAPLLAYAIWRRDPVFILGQSLGFFIYARNLWLIHAEGKNVE